VAAVTPRSLADHALQTGCDVNETLAARERLGLPAAVRWTIAIASPISCRNVMIYFDRMLQERALQLFSDSLCRRGFLGVGARESLRFTGHERSFTELSERWYRRC
jgi:chemotaxis protein methyltransferase CheR